MKFILFSIICICQAQASSTLAMLAIAVSAQEQELKPKSELELELSELRKTIPARCSGSAWNSCWERYPETSMVKKVSKKNGNQIWAQLKNQGYRVSLKEDELIFDFSIEHAMFLEHDQKPLSTNSIVLLSLLSLILAIVFQTYYKHLKTVKRVKSTLKEEDLYWLDSKYKDELKQSLAKNTTPTGWHFRWDEENKIKGISKTTEHGFENIASHKEMFSKLFNR